MTLTAENEVWSGPRLAVVAVTVVGVCLAFVGASGYPFTARYWLLATAAALMAAIAVRYPRPATAMAVAAICLVPVYWARPVPGPVVPTPAVVACLLLVLAAARQVQSVRLGALDYAFLAYLFLLGASTLIVTDTRPGAAIQLLATAALPFAVFRCVAVDRATRLAAAIGIAGAAGVLSVVGLFERSGTDNPFFHIVSPHYLADLWAHPEERFDTTRAEASFGHPIAFGLFLAVAVLLTLGLARQSHHPARWYFIAAIGVAAMLATLSRGPLLAAGVGTAFWVLTRRRNLNGRDLMVVAGVVVALAAVPAARDTLTRLTGETFSVSREGASAEYRLQLIDLATEPGHFSLLGEPMRSASAPATDRLVSQSIDSEYVLLYLRNGLLPALAFALCGVICLLLLRRVAQDPLDAAWLAAGVTIFVGLLTVALIAQFQALAFVVLGVCAAAGHPAAPTPAHDLNNPS